MIVHSTKFTIKKI